VERCRDCKLYDLDRTKNARGAVLRNRVARCLWKSTETWPVSVNAGLNRRPEPSYMQPDDGDRCQRFIKRDQP
jgi:hypothetical protein